jgi:hypothetical protein
MLLSYIKFLITFNPNKEGLLTHVYGNKNILQRSKCILGDYHIYDWFWSLILMCIVIFNVESLVYELVISLFFNGWPFFKKMTHVTMMFIAYVKLIYTTKSM